MEFKRRAIDFQSAARKQCGYPMAVFVGSRGEKLNDRELFKRFAKPGEQFDDDWLEAFHEKVREEGDLVAQKGDSGNPGAGAGSDCVYAFQKLFFVDGDLGNDGAYETFSDAADDCMLSEVTETTKKLWVKLDEECPYQVVLPRRQLSDDSEIMNFLMSYVGKFDMYIEDEYAAFVRYCFQDPLDAAIFRSRFEPKAERVKLAG